MIDFTPFRQARLGPVDIAKLLGVSRVTVSGWLNGHAQPHHLLSTRVQGILDNVGHALEAGELPVPHDVNRRERGLYIQQVLARHSAASTLGL